MGSNYSWVRTPSSHPALNTGTRREIVKRGSFPSPDLGGSGGFLLVVARGLCSLKGSRRENRAAVWIEAFGLEPWRSVLTWRLQRGGTRRPTKPSCRWGGSSGRPREGDIQGKDLQGLIFSGKSLEETAEPRIPPSPGSKALDGGIVSRLGIWIERTEVNTRRSSGISVVVSVREVGIGFWSDV